MLSCLGAVARRAEVLGAGWVFSIEYSPLAVTLPKTRKTEKTLKMGPRPPSRHPPFPLYQRHIFVKKRVYQDSR